MATEPILVVLDVSAAQGRPIANSNVLFDYWELTKPEINFLIAITTAAGFGLASPAVLPHVLWMQLLHTLTALGIQVKRYSEVTSLVIDARHRRGLR